VNREVVKKAKDVLDKTIGQNIRAEREVRNLSREELAEILDLTTSHMGLIERGERGATGVTLQKLSRALDTSIDDLFQSRMGKTLNLQDPSTDDELDVSRKKIASLITYLTEAELNFVISVIKGLIKMNHSNPILDDGTDDEIDDEHDA